MKQPVRVHRGAAAAKTLVRVEAGAAGGRVLRLPPAAGRAAATGGPPAAESAAAGAVGAGSRIGELLIRLLDVAGALTILALALPVMLVSALLIKLTSPGPVLYKQERVGQGGRLFTLCKFRTMVVDIEAGKYAPSLPLAFRIAKAFGIGVEEVFQYRDDEMSAPAP